LEHAMNQAKYYLSDENYFKIQVPLELLKHIL